MTMRHLDVRVARDESRGGAERGRVAREAAALARTPNRSGLAQRHERLGEGHGLGRELGAQRRIVRWAADHWRDERAESAHHAQVRIGRANRGVGVAERIHEHDAGEVVGVAERECEGRDRAPRMRDEQRLLGAELAQRETDETRLRIERGIRAVRARCRRIRVDR